jgi:glutathione S-transferase
LALEKARSVVLKREEQMKIVTGPISLFAAKAEIAALEKALPYERVEVPFTLAARYEPRHPDVLRINPKRQVPVLIDDDLEIFDSTQIAEYLEHLVPEPPLWPREPKARARARLLEHKADEIFAPHVIKILPGNAKDDDETAAAKEGIAAYQREMDALLAGREYLADMFSHADIALFMAQYFACMMRANVPRELGNLWAWQARVAARDSVMRVTAGIAGFLESNNLPAPQIANLAQAAA